MSCFSSIPILSINFKSFNCVNILLLIAKLTLRHSPNPMCESSIMQLKCLRYIAAKNEITDYLYISIVNPARYPADGNQCECFKTAVKVHVAWGLKRLLDRIPYEDAVSIRMQLVGHYGKTGYYRFYRGERGLMPKDQAYIKQIFRNKGIKEEPTYQRYTEEYIW